MKKYLVLFLTLILSFTMLTACGEKEKPSVLADKTLEEIQTAIYEEKMPDLSLMSMDVNIDNEDELKSFTGLTKDDAGKIKEVVVSESAMGAQPYSLVLVRLNDAKDAETIANAMKSGIDQRKWVCVEADDLRVSASEDVVMLIMVGSTFSDVVTSQEITDAFKTVAGGSLSVELN